MAHFRTGAMRVHWYGVGDFYKIEFILSSSHRTIL